MKKLTLKRRILFGLMALLAVLVLVRRLGFNLEGLPLPSNIQTQEREYSKLQRKLLKLLKNQQGWHGAQGRLQAQARGFWRAGSRAPAAEVQSEFEKMCRRARVTVQSIGTPRVNKVSEHVRSVTISVRMRASMREVSRLMDEIEQANPNFYWSSCNIRPDSSNNPQGVVLTGKMEAYVLSAEATRIIYGEDGASS
jgi:hypothetical protein